MSIFATDAVGSVLKGALSGLSIRQNVIADNIANVDTPGFRATSVDFESSLRDAISDGQDAAASINDHLNLLATPTDSPVGVNGNNVDLRKETMAAMQTVFQYQMVSRATGDRLENIKIATGQ